MYIQHRKSKVYMHFKRPFFTDSKKTFAFFLTFTVLILGFLSRNVEVAFYRFLFRRLKAVLNNQNGKSEIQNENIFGISDKNGPLCYMYRYTFEFCC